MGADCLTEQEQTALKKFKDAVCQILGSTGWEIRLFGSRSRGEGDENSDVDLLVLLDSLDYGKKVRIWDAAEAVFSETDVLLSPHVLSREQYNRLLARERLIALDIERDGIAI